MFNKGSRGTMILHGVRYLILTIPLGGLMAMRIRVVMRTRTGCGFDLSTTWLPWVTAT